MANRIKQLNATLKRIGLASLVLFVGATARPATSAIPAAPAIKAIATPVVAAKAIAAAAPAATEMLHDTAVTASAAIAPSAISHKLRTIRMEVTAYCPRTKCCGENAQGLTASGHDVSYNNSRFVAADTDNLAFGTKLVIPGYAGGAVEVIDRGGAIKGNKLDVFFPTHEEALQWGRQFLDVTVLE
jgi:3D (Asp-Asp-Asp) domain-containing protein